MNDKCREHTAQHRYYLLFGAIPVHVPPLVFPDNTHSYRITERSTVGDAFFTAILGFFITLRRDTIVLEICDSSMLVISSEKLKRQIEEEREKVNQEVARKQEEKLNAILDALKPDPNLPELQAVFLKSGEILRGEISETTTTEILIKINGSEPRKILRTDIVRIVYLSKEQS
ncbi:MAG: hypothetical protein JNM27_00275 [Leptospirales bacterium]|nr:hypothetical protein [Leptospirales bacterium]